MHEFLHSLTGVPLPLYLLVLLPFALRYFVRRRPTTPPQTQINHALELGAYWFLTFLILLGLYITSVVRVGLEQWPH